MTERELGRSGLQVSEIGLGCMGMTEFYDPKQMNDEESIRVIHRYLDAGGNSRWRGCSRRGRTSCRFRARSGSSTSTSTLRRSRST
jgi:hypothetical protein